MASVTTNCAYEPELFRKLELPETNTRSPTWICYKYLLKIFVAKYYLEVGDAPADVVDVARGVGARAVGQLRQPAVLPWGQIFIYLFIKKYLFY